MGYSDEQRESWDAGRVAELRQRLGLSQQEFARLLGVRQQTISEWETGLHSPRGTSNRVLNMAAEQAATYETRPARGKRRRAAEDTP